MDRSLGLALQPDPERWTLPRFLADVAERYGDRPALRSPERAQSFAGLRAQARALAAGLLAVGVAPGTRVALWLGNRPEWAEAAFGVWLAGGVAVPVSTFATGEELEHALRGTGASVLLLQRGVAGRDLLAVLRAAHPEIARERPGRLRCPALPHLRHVFALGSEDEEAGVEPWEALRTRGGDVPDPLVDAAAGAVRPSDDAVVIHTSGTTGRPKAILHAQRAPVIQSWRFAELLDLGPDDRILTAQPFFWTAGMAMSLGASLAAGACLLVDEVFEPGAALARIEAERATALFAWPHQEKAMAEHPDAAARDLGSLEKLEPTSALAALAGLREDRWGSHSAYGLSETFTLAAALPARAPADERAACQGRPLPGTEIRIVDPGTGERLPAGTAGEIAVRGATLMRGYLGVPPEATFDAEGFYRTQDAGSLDAEGRLHWTGRLSRLIKTGGANVSPVEIEEALARYPGLAHAAAVGVPHPELGEAVVLCAVPSEGAALDPEALRRFLRERLAPYKVPRRVLLFAEHELAFTDTRKLQTAPLRDAALRRLAADRAEIQGHRYTP